MPEQWNKYAATVARRHGKAGREIRPKTVTIDIHSHVAVPAAAKFVEPHLDRATVPLAHFANAETKALSQTQEADIRARSGHDHRLADLDAMGIDIQMIAPPPPQCYYTVPLDIAVKATQIVNDGIAEFCSVKPDRLKAFGAVPMTDGTEAARELDRCIKKLGFTRRGSLNQCCRKRVVGSGLRAVLAKSRTTRRAGDDPSQRLHRGIATDAVLFQQCHR